MTRRITAKRPPIDWDEALRLHADEGWSYADIAREYEYAYKTIFMGLRKRGAKPRRQSQARRTKRGAKLVELWRFMREKCTVPEHSSYERYGAMGVRVCREWDESFDAFYAWAVKSGYRIGLRLARKNRRWDYTLGNCHWVTADEKAQRRQGSRSPSWTLTAFGETKGSAAWSKDPRCNVSPSTLLHRIRRGDSPEKAITAPRDSTRKPGAKSPPQHSKRRPIDWEEATRLYLKEGLSQPEVARRVGASYTGVVAGFKRLDVRRERKPGPTSTPEGRRLHKTWESLHRRCVEPSDALYPYTGAKGVRVCGEWVEFAPFLEWAIESGAKPGLCLVRRNRQGDYSRTNCEWVTRAEASRRTAAPTKPRRSRTPIAAFGEDKGVVAWSKDPRCSVSATTISARLAKGWPTESAITAPRENLGGSDIVYTELEAFGLTKGLTDWTRDHRCKVSLTGLSDRLRRGWSAEDALSTPPYQQPRAT